MFLNSFELMNTVNISKKLNISIRTKIALLIGISLFVFLISYLYVGTSLIIKDKTSYVYDNNLSHVKNISSAVEARIEKEINLMKLISQWFNPNNKVQSVKQMQLAFKEYEKETRLSEFLLIKSSTRGQWSIESSFQSTTGPLEKSFDSLKVPVDELKSSKIYIGSVLDGKIPIMGVLFDLPNKETLAFFTMMTLNKKLFDGISDLYQIYVLDSQSNIILSNLKENNAKHDFKSFEEKISSSNFKTGVQDWDSLDDTWVTGYKTFLNDQIVILAMIPKSIAFAAAKTLTERSILLAGSLFLLILGFAIFFSASLTMRLKQMASVTDKVRSGDFSSRVESDSGRTEDEVTQLAVSFNAMADKIDELMLATAEKVRMEKELETAQLVQSRFFPEEKYEHNNLKLGGAFMPATECAGDWWQFSVNGNYLTVLVGDVTGHGVSAALVTAAAYSAFSLWKKQTEFPTLESLINQLNTAVYHAGHGETTMSMIASVINLDTGYMTTINAGHATPYLYRKTESGNPFKPIVGGKAPALGVGEYIEFTPSNMQLNPTDTILWYSDGILEPRESDGAKMSKISFCEMLKEVADQCGEEALSVSKKIMDRYLDFLEHPHHRPDDMTVVVGVIPNSADFYSSEVTGTFIRKKASA